MNLNLNNIALSNCTVSTSSSQNNTILAATRLSVRSRTVLQRKPHSRMKFTLVHLSAMVFATIIILISALLGK